MAVDKYRAQHQQWRVREFTLMLLALLGGSLGTLLAMCACHHKTQHKKFTILVPLLLVLQTVLVVVLPLLPSSKPVKEKINHVEMHGM